uniref:Uncharacterized protein n=1 Tax=Arundo donax TaxID=35708 RepID=A0A0A9BYP1_ARUDO
MKAVASCRLPSSAKIWLHPSLILGVREYGELVFDTIGSPLFSLVLKIGLL